MAARWAGCRRPAGGKRFTGAFQDFFRFEFSAQRSVGLGDLPRLDNEPAVRRGAESRSRRCAPALAGGPEQSTRLDLAGRSGLSFGQWQKLALSRGDMRDGRPPDGP